MSATSSGISILCALWELQYAVVPLMDGAVVAEIEYPFTRQCAKDLSDVVRVHDRETKS